MKKIMENREIKCGIILSYIEQVITILSGLIYTPIMLRLLGKSEYGLYQLAYSIISFLGLLNFGFASGYLRLYFRYKKNEDKVGIESLNGMYLLIFLLVSVLAIVSGIVIIASCGEIFDTGLSLREIERIKTLIFIMILSLVITFMTSVFDCYLTAYNKFIFQRMVMLLKSLLNPFICLPLLFMGYKSEALALVSLLLSVSGFIISIYYCLNKLDMKFKFKTIDLNVFKELFSFTFFIFLSSIVDKINLSLDNFLLGRYSGTVIVATYGVGAQINVFYNKISTSISSIFAPKINAILVKDNCQNEILELFIKISKPLFLILISVWSGFLFFGKIFITIWAGKQYIDSYYVALILMLSCIIPLTQVCGIEIQKAKNMHKMRSVIYFFAALVNVIISIPLIKKYGAIGASIGTLITMIISNCIFMNFYYHKIVKLDMIIYWKEIIPLIRFLIASIIIGIIYLLFSSKSLIESIVYGGIYILCIFCSIMIEYHSSEKKEKIFEKRN